MSDPAKRFAALIKRLKSEFETPQETAGAVAPPPATTADSVLDQMVYSFLLWETTTTHATTAHKRLREAFVDLNEVRVCFPEEISAAVGERFPKSRERASRLRAVLNDIYRREHGLTLARLIDQPKREARMYLESLEGMPSFVAARVALVGLACHAVPVDERLLSLLAQERAVEPDVSVEEASSWIERQVRANEAAPTHQLLRSWADEEGGGSKRKPAGRSGPTETASAAEADGKKTPPRKRPTKPKTSK